MRNEKVHVFNLCNFNLSKQALIVSAQCSGISMALLQFLQTFADIYMYVWKEMLGHCTSL